MHAWNSSHCPFDMLLLHMRVLLAMCGLPLPYLLAFFLPAAVQGTAALARPPCSRHHFSQVFSVQTLLAKALASKTASEVCQIPG